MIYRTLYRIISRQKQNLLNLKAVKEYLRINNHDDDELVENIIEGAVDVAERLTKTTIVNKTILIKECKLFAT